MQFFDSIDRMRHTAIYVRISTASQKPDRQQEELTSFAELNQLNFNRNQGIKRPTLLKDLLRCGECGSRMCSVTKARGTAYQCAARSGRVNIKCILGLCVLMSKLDGLVLHVCIFRWRYVGTMVTFTIEKSDINSLSVYFYIFGLYLDTPVIFYKTAHCICGYVTVTCTNERSGGSAMVAEEAFCIRIMPPQPPLHLRIPIHTSK